MNYNAWWELNHESSKKEACVAQVQHDFAASSASFVVGIQGLTVAQIRGLRTSLRKEHGTLQVVKNTLSRHAVKQSASLQGLESYLYNQVALVFAAKDPVSVARAICEYAQRCERLHIVAGSLGAQVINDTMVRFLGTLPSREIVLAQLCGALQAPLVAQVSFGKRIMLHFVLVLQAVQKQKESV